MFIALTANLYVVPPITPLTVKLVTLPTVSTIDVSLFEGIPLSQERLYAMTGLLPAANPERATQFIFTITSVLEGSIVGGAIYVGTT